MDLLPALCLCLLICSGAAFSHQSGSKVIRKVVKEDEDVLLACALEGTNIQDDVFDWKKHESRTRQVFFYNRGSHYLNGHPGQDDQFKDRVFYFEEQLAVGNASIVIRKTKVADNGNYTCDFPFREPRRRSQYELIVGAASKPIPSLNKTKDGVLLQCDVEGAFPKPRVEWWDSSGNILPAEEKFTQKDISFDVFLQTTVTKSGFYRCVATQEEIHNEVYTETYVSVPGAASEPSVTIVKQTKDWALLRCVVKGASPKPAVLWKDDSGNIIESEEAEVTERGGSYDIVLKTTVTKTDYYHCVVTQEDIDHQVSAKIHVFFGDSTGWIIGFVVVTVVLVIVLMIVIVLVKKLRSNSSKGSSLPSDSLTIQPLDV